MLAINKISAVNNSVVDIATNWMPSMDVVRRMNATAEQYRVYQARHLMAGTEEEVNRQEAIVNKTGDALTALFKQYDAMATTAEERKIYDALKQSGAHYMQLVPDFLKASRCFLGLPLEGLPAVTQRHGLRFVTGPHIAIGCVGDLVDEVVDLPADAFELGPLTVNDQSQFLGTLGLLAGVG